MSSRVLASESMRLSPIASVAACGALLAMLTYAATVLVPASEWFSVKVAAGYLVAAGLVLGFALERLPPAGFGLANAITLLRAALTALLLGVAFETPTDELLWLCVVIATTALLLDGVDGWTARRRGEASAFGARFDMETDAALMLVLAALVWLLDRAGAWILLAGALRYVFIGASVLVAPLRRPLPPSTRRKTACIVQLIALVVALGPIIPAAAAAGAAALGLIFLSYSFMLDVVWLLRRARRWI